MTTTMLYELIEKADALLPEEQWQLANHLVARALRQMPAARPRRKWREIRGLAKPSLFGEDAQTYISRTRREGDEHRATCVIKNVPVQVCPNALFAGAERPRLG